MNVTYPKGNAISSRHENISVMFITYGCAKNEVDTTEMKIRILEAGYSLTEDIDEAQAVIVNTCAFIQDAIEENVELILELVGMTVFASHEKRLIVAGCLPARFMSEIEREIPEADAWVPCSKEDDIVDVLDGCFSHTSSFSDKSIDYSNIEHLLQVVEAPNPSFEKHNSDSLGSTVSAYVKISEGCDRFCSYCTIPFIRGRYHSFPLKEIKQDIAFQIARGCREIVLIAQDTGQWGKDLEEPSSLATLLSALAAEFSDTWFRILYIQPEGITDELLTVIRDHSNICRYLDIPLQHCNEQIIKRMNRHGSASEYLATIEHIRQIIPDVTLRTTLITGFPGETDEQFEELYDFLEEAQFDYVGVFPYSKEDGTKAAEMPGQIPQDTKIERAQEVRDFADSLSTAKIQSRIGSEVHVLIEGIEEDGQLFGRTMQQAPEVDGVTYLDSGSIGEFVIAHIDDTLLYEMEGSVR